MPKGEGFIEITPIGWDELSKQLGDPELVRAALNSGLKKAGKEILVPFTKQQSPYGVTGNLKNKTVGQVLGRNEDMRLEIRQSVFSKSQFPYGVAVRTGSKPHFPPSKELEAWVKKKWNAANPKSAAFVLAMRIAGIKLNRKAKTSTPWGSGGTKANPYHERVIEQTEGLVHDVMQDQIAKVINEKVKGKV